MISNKTLPSYQENVSQTSISRTVPQKESDQKSKNFHHKSSEDSSLDKFSTFKDAFETLSQNKTEASTIRRGPLETKRKADDLWEKVKVGTLTPQPETKKIEKIFQDGGILVGVRIRDTALGVRIPKKKDLQVPKSAIDKLLQWNKLQKSPLSEGEIRAAILKFEKECGCEWLLAAQKMAPSEMWVINQLREQGVLNPIIEKLKEKYPDVVIQDWGSSDLTSDKDLNFIFPKGRWHEEHAVVREFNVLYEKAWPQSSATVFNSNPYPGYHLETVIDPDAKPQQQQLHFKMSWVMFYLNAKELGEKPWELAKQKLNPEVAIAIEKFADEVETLLNFKIVSTAVAKELLDPSHGLKGTGNIIKKVADIYLSDINDVKKSAEKIKKNNPDIAIQAANRLHEEIANGIPIFYEAHEKVLSLLHSKNEVEFKNQYKAAIDAIISTKLFFLEELNQFPTSIAKMEENQKKIKLLQAEIAYWSGAKIREISDEDIKSFIAHPGEEPSSSEIFFLLFEADNLLIEKQAIDMRSRCFAQEMHISEGAFMFVVLDTQGKSGELRSLYQYTQANNELLGFYFRHQTGDQRPALKMIEVSKYMAPRFLLSYEKMKERANKIGCGENFPIFSGIENLKGYFEEIYALRKNKIPEAAFARAIVTLEKKYPDKEDLGKLLTECTSDKDIEQKLSFLKLEDRKFIAQFFPDARGFIQIEQKIFLEKEIRKNYNIESTSDGEPDIDKINARVADMVFTLNSWSQNLSERERIDVS